MKCYIAKHSILFTIGAILYLLIEILWRGHTHWAMGIVGGCCFILIGLINELFPWNLQFPIQMGIASLIVTFVEFIAGCILNLLLNLNIWDYSQLWGNILGQICPQFIIAWFFLSIPAIILDDYLRYWLFHEEKPRYALFN